MLFCYPSLRLAALRARTVCHVRPKCLEGRKSTITSKVAIDAFSHLTVDVFDSKTNSFDGVVWS